MRPSPAVPNRMLVIGDSICCGYTDGTEPLPLGCLESFPYLTRQKLRDTIGLEFAVDLVAFPGWTLVSPTTDEAEEGAPKGMAEKFFHVRELEDHGSVFFKRARCRFLPGTCFPVNRTNLLLSFLSL